MEHPKSVSYLRHNDRHDPGGPVVIIPGSMDFSERKNPEYDVLRKGSKAVDPVFVDLRHVKEPQAESTASEQNLSGFSRSMSEATHMT